jgi:MGT family glycosyltransferase
VIYISLGTVFNSKVHFYRLCLEAFANLKYCVILSVGNKVDIASLGAIPNNFIVKPFVPQLQVLQRAVLFITHGGMNSVSEGLYEGVPLLMIPQAADQTFIAQRVQQLGAGKLLRNTKVNAQSLRKAAEELLAQHTFRQASVALSAPFRQSGGPKLAVDEIEGFKRKHGI